MCSNWHILLLFTECQSSSSELSSWGWNQGTDAFKRMGFLVGLGPMVPPASVTIFLMPFSDLTSPCWTRGYSTYRVTSTLPWSAIWQLCSGKPNLKSRNNCSCIHRGTRGNGDYWRNVHCVTICHDLLLFANVFQSMPIFSTIFHYLWWTYDDNCGHMS